MHVYIYISKALLDFPRWTSTCHRRRSPCMASFVVSPAGVYRHTAAGRTHAPASIWRWPTENWPRGDQPCPGIAWPATYINQGLVVRSSLISAGTFFSLCDGSVLIVSTYVFELFDTIDHDVLLNNLFGSSQCWPHRTYVHTETTSPVRKDENRTKNASMFAEFDLFLFVPRACAAHNWHKTTGVLPVLGVFRRIV